MPVDQGAQPLGGNGGGHQARKGARCAVASRKARPPRTVVMPWLDHGIHSPAVATSPTATDWIAGSSPAMTTEMYVPRTVMQTLNRHAVRFGPGAQLRPHLRGRGAVVDHGVHAVRQ